MSNENQPKEEKINPNEEMYAIFCGDINFANANKFSANISQASILGAKHLHVLFHSWGGFVADGIYLYNLFNNFNIELTFYNMGQISSAASIAYLGAKNRVTTENGGFMIHKAHMSPQASSAEKLKVSQEDLVLEDKKIEDILKARLKLPEELWERHKHYDVNMNGGDAVKYGLATSLGFFAPPQGVVVYNILA